eukprot:scaffold55671_cov34-Prasinocladus_malaysianus.AAC.1
MAKPTKYPSTAASGWGVRTCWARAAECLPGSHGLLHHCRAKEWRSPTATAMTRRSPSTRSKVIAWGPVSFLPLP